MSTTNILELWEIISYWSVGLALLNGIKNDKKNKNYGPILSCDAYAFASYKIYAMVFENRRPISNRNEINEQPSQLKRFQGNFNPFLISRINPPPAGLYQH